MPRPTTGARTAGVRLTPEEWSEAQVFGGPSAFLRSLVDTHMASRSTKLLRQTTPGLTPGTAQPYKTAGDIVEDVRRAREQIGRATPAYRDARSRAVEQGVDWLALQRVAVPSADVDAMNEQERGL